MKKAIKQFLKDLLFEIDEEGRKLLRKVVRAFRDESFKLLTFILYKI